MRELYITVYKSVGGWKAVLVHPEDGEIQTGLASYNTRDKAVNEGREWAESENICFYGGELE